MYLSEWQESENLYDKILRDNELGMFTNCEHEFDWFVNELVVSLYAEIYELFPPLFITCNNCAGMYPLPRYMEMM